jgi:hypothetical protein
MSKPGRVWGWKIRVVLRVGAMLALAVASARSSLAWTITAVWLLLASVADLDFERSRM